MADTFTPPLAPSPGTSRDREGRVWRADMGDGYVQLSPRGIQTRLTIATVVWSGLTHSDAGAINQFFNQHTGEHFLYALPPDATTRKWICEKWRRDEVDSNASAITATFEEVYDIP